MYSMVPVNDCSNPIKKVSQDLLGILGFGGACWGYTEKVRKDLSLSALSADLALELDSYSQRENCLTCLPSPPHPSAKSSG